MPCSTIKNNSLFEQKATTTKLLGSLNACAAFTHFVKL